MRLHDFMWVITALSAARMREEVDLECDILCREDK
jgi:hypothetical protein